MCIYFHSSLMIDCDKQNKCNVYWRQDKAGNIFKPADIWDRKTRNSHPKGECQCRNYIFGTATVGVWLWVHYVTKRCEAANPRGQCELPPLIVLQASFAWIYYPRVICLWCLTRIWYLVLRVGKNDRIQSIKTIQWCSEVRFALSSVLRVIRWYRDDSLLTGSLQSIVSIWIDTSYWGLAQDLSIVQNISFISYAVLHFRDSKNHIDRNTKWPREDNFSLKTNCIDSVLENSKQPLNYCVMWFCTQIYTLISKKTKIRLQSREVLTFMRISHFMACSWNGSSSVSVRQLAFSCFGVNGPHLIVKRNFERKEWSWYCSRSTYKTSCHRPAWLRRP